MLFVKYETWCECVRGLYDKPPNSLQTFPFRRKEGEHAWLLDKSFFEQQIKSGKVFLNPYTWLVEDSIMLFKDDGHSRLNTTLISPMLLLIYTAVAKELSNLYESPQREGYYPFYGGNFKKNEFTYGYAYDQYRKTLLDNKAKYTHYKFIDISNFYPSINLPCLLEKIDAGIDSNKLSLKDKLFITRLLEYLGKGYFPTIDHSVASFYLATIIYLEGFDTSLHDYLETNKKIKDFLLVRYVDDCYILVNFEESANEHDEDEQLNSKIEEWLRPLRLAVNTKKTTSFCNVETLDERLSLSPYDYWVNNPKRNFPQAVKLERWRYFLEELVQHSTKNGMNFETYNGIVTKIYTELKPQYPSLKKHKDIFNQVFDASVVLHKDYIGKLKGLLENHLGVLKYSGHNLVPIILASKNKKLIDIFLRKISRENKINPSIWNSRLSISYLLSRSFMSTDLMKDIKANTEMIPRFYEYIEHYCCTNFAQYYTDISHTPVLKLVQNNLSSNQKIKPAEALAKSIYLYFLYKCEYSPANYLQRYAFYKNYFDAITAVIAGTSVENCYKEKTLKGIYKSINGSDVVITEAHKLRNGNPLAHASSTLLDIHTAPSDIDKMISNLDKLILNLIFLSKNSHSLS